MSGFMLFVSSGTVTMLIMNSVANLLALIAIVRAKTSTNIADARESFGTFKAGDSTAFHGKTIVGRVWNAAAYPFDDVTELIGIDVAIQL